MRILVTNDDGIDAPGLAVLETAARALASDVWTVAPEKEQSGKSHAVSLTEPLRARRVGDHRFAVSGTPADCVALALEALMRDTQPDLVLSGVNAGYNVADDVIYSGTVGAAREAAGRGVRAIALSQALPPREDRRPGDPLFAAAAAFAPRILRRLIDVTLPPRQILNVNFPPCPAEAVAGVSITRQGARKMNRLRTEERVDARGLRYYWLGFNRDAADPEPDVDLAAIAARRISVTPLGIDLTAHDSLKALTEKGVIAAPFDG